jgi:lysophospholipase L1-like esterase
VKKTSIAIIVASGLSALLVLGIIRLIAPQLLGVPIDLKMVQASEEVVPFFDGVFRLEDYQSATTYIKDPYLHQRRKPLQPDIGTFGPTDILGFRNGAIPARADIVAIGDSQTFGNNAQLGENWPNLLVKNLAAKQPSIYNMSTAGWGAIEYYEIFSKALFFRPQVIIVAFYTGNDAADTYMRAYANERWADLRPAHLQTIDPPLTVVWPPSPLDRWAVNLDNGTKTTFTPELRLSQNSNHPGIEAGYEIMAEVGRRMAKMTSGTRTHLIFAVIPTKEFAFAKKIAFAGIEKHSEYQALVEAEGKHIEKLASQLKAIPRTDYVDVAKALQYAILISPKPIYPQSTDGHPTPQGYAAIAGALQAVVDKNLRPPRKK